MIAEDAVLNQCFEISNDVDIFKKKLFGIKYLKQEKMDDLSLEIGCIILC